MEDVRVSRRVVIPGTDLEMRVSRSGGPGGQGVNTTDSKVELRLDLDGTSALSEADKALVRERLGNRVTSDGVLVIQSSERRSQHKNREAAVARLQALLGDAIRPRRRRRPTGRTRASHERRLADKKRRGETKRLRQDPEP